MGMNRMRHIVFFLLLLLCSVQSYCQMGKMSPYLRRMQMLYAQNARGVAAGGLSAQRVRRTTALVRTGDASLLQSDGCRILASWDDVHVVSIPLPQLAGLAARPEILRIEAGEPSRLTNDTIAGIVGVCASPFASPKVKDVRNTYGLTGRGVVIGVMDVGFDLSNPNYLTQDGQTYRVRSLWDQLDWSEGGEAVGFLVTVADSLGGMSDTVYTAPGRQYTDGVSILRKGCTADSLVAYHGTHTSGTAAGSGLGGNTYQKPLGWPLEYCGMAPDADLCLVGNIVDENADVVPEEHLTEYTTATDLLGFKYIFDYAQRVGRPCVISFSEGTPQDLHDNLLYDEVLSKMVGGGRIICASAGNEGFKGTYIHKATDEDCRGAFLTSKSKMAYYTLCSSEPVRFSLSFYSPDGGKRRFNFDTTLQSAHPDSIFNDTLCVSDSMFVVTSVVYPDCYDGTRYATELLVRNLQDGLIGLTALPIALTVDGTGYEAEVFGTGSYFQRNGLDASLQDFSYDHGILYPGSSPAVITVGMTGHSGPRVNLYGQLSGVSERYGVGGVISGYGSKGPTMDGVVKPDVVAPGTNVLSAHSSYYFMHHTEVDDWLMNVSEYNGRQYPWRLNTGTSMSTPVVAGIIALWLQECPTLSPDDVREVFANTCRRGDASLSYPNNSWGWGEIDAVAGLEYIMRHYTGIDEIKGGSQGLRNSVSQDYDLMGRRIPDSSAYRGVIVKADGSKVVR